jgi:hypothetical protein
MHKLLDATQTPHQSVYHLAVVPFLAPYVLLAAALQSLVRTFPGMADYPLPEGLKGLASVVVDSVNCCDTDVRKDLYQHVVLTGERWV